LKEYNTAGTELLWKVGEIEQIDFSLKIGKGLLLLFFSFAF
jgi:hypothetical protein